MELCDTGSMRTVMLKVKRTAYPWVAVTQWQGSVPDQHSPPTATDQAPRSVCSQATILTQHESSVLPTMHLSDETGLICVSLVVFFCCQVENVNMSGLNAYMVMVTVHGHVL